MCTDGAQGRAPRTAPLARRRPPRPAPIVIEAAVLPVPGGSPRDASMLAKLSTRPAVRRCAVTGAAGLALVAAGLPAVASDGNGSDLSRFYRQKVTWTKCKGDGMPKDLQCGKVTVPLDYTKPKAGTLDLALARYRATGKKRGS